MGQIPLPLKLTSVTDHLVMRGCLFKRGVTVPVIFPQERPVYKDGHTAAAGKWGPQGEVEVDELGRPVVWPSGRESLRGAEMEREKEERRRRVMSYLKSSNMSLVQSNSSCRKINTMCCRDLYLDYHHCCHGDLHFLKFVAIRYLI